MENRKQVSPKLNLSLITFKHINFFGKKGGYTSMLDVLPAEYFQNVLLFQAFFATLPTFLRPVAGIKFEISSFSG